MNIHAYSKIHTKQWMWEGQCDESVSCRLRNRNRKFEIAPELLTPVVVANVEI